MVCRRTAYLKILKRVRHMKMAASVNSGVLVKFVNENKGRGLFATKHFSKGDVILEESPLVSCQFAWNELYNYTACELCLRSLETAEEMARRLTNNPALVLPHPECCEVKSGEITLCPHCQIQYCSESCRVRAWLLYHQTLCLGTSRQDPEHPLNRLLERWRTTHYPPETASIMMLVKMIAMVKQAQDRDGLLSQFSQFVKVTVNEEEHAVHKLLGKHFQEQLEVLQEMMSQPPLYEDSVKNWYTPEGFRSMFALMGTNQQGIGSSSISTWCKNCDKLQLPEDEKDQLDSFIDQMYDDLDKVSGDFLNCEGAGLYKLQSACNHSCDPNAEISFLHGDHRLTLTALSDITPEEEIFICYLGECDRERSRHSRQKLLKENYLFNCECSRCYAQADDPDVTSEEELDDDDDSADDDESNMWDDS